MLPGVTTTQKIYLCTMQFLKNMVISVGNCGAIHENGFKKNKKIHFLHIYFLFGMKKVYVPGAPGVTTT